jgi:hypothetical protein
MIDCSASECQVEQRTAIGGLRRPGKDKNAENPIGLSSFSSRESQKIFTADLAGQQELLIGEPLF